MLKRSVLTREVKEVDSHVPLWIEATDAVHLVRRRGAEGSSTADLGGLGPHALSCHRFSEAQNSEVSISTYTNATMAHCPWSLVGHSTECPRQSTRWRHSEADNRTRYRTGTTGSRRASRLGLRDTGLLSAGSRPRPWPSGWPSSWRRRLGCCSK